MHRLSFVVVGWSEKKGNTHTTLQSRDERMEKFHNCHFGEFLIVRELVSGKKKSLNRKKGEWEKGKKNLNNTRAFNRHLTYIFVAISLSVCEWSSEWMNYKRRRKNAKSSCKFQTSRHSNRGLSIIEWQQFILAAHSFMKCDAWVRRREELKHFKISPVIVVACLWAASSSSSSPAGRRQKW